MRVPMLAWVDPADDITPPVQTEWLAHAMRDLRVWFEKGHQERCAHCFT